MARTVSENWIHQWVMTVCGGSDNSDGTGDNDGRIIHRAKKPGFQVIQTVPVVQMSDKHSYITCTLSANAIKKFTKTSDGLVVSDMKGAIVVLLDYSLSYDDTNVWIDVRHFVFIGASGSDVMGEPSYIMNDAQVKLAHERLWRVDDARTHNASLKNLQLGDVCKRAIITAKQQRGFERLLRGEAPIGSDDDDDGEGCGGGGGGGVEESQVLYATQTAALRTERLKVSQTTSESPQRLPMTVEGVTHTYLGAAEGVAKQPLQKNVDDDNHAVPGAAADDEATQEPPIYEVSQPQPASQLASEDEDEGGNERRARPPPAEGSADGSVSDEFVPPTNPTSIHAVASQRRPLPSMPDTPGRLMLTDQTTVNTQDIALRLLQSQSQSQSQGIMLPPSLPPPPPRSVGGSNSHSNSNGTTSSVSNTESSSTLSPNVPLAQRTKPPSPPKSKSTHRSKSAKRSHAAAFAIPTKRRAARPISRTLSAKKKRGRDASLSSAEFTECITFIRHKRKKSSGENGRLWLDFIR